MEKRKALLVDDEPVIVEGFRRLVDWEAHGFALAATCGDGVTALKMLREMQPDLAVVDINIPLLSGLDVIAQAKPACPGTSFVVISGYDDFSYVRKALLLHTADYILKPVDFTAFGELLDALHLKLLGGTPQVSAGDAGDGGDLLRQLIDYINTHLEGRITLEQLARRFHMNSAYLSHYFKTHAGINYHEYLTAQRISKGKQLLLSTGKPVSQIAREVGFSSYRSFSSVFKKVSGLSPSEFRLANGPPGKSVVK